MRVLLDEMVSRKLAVHLGGHEVTTVQRQGWAGLSNGRLLDAIGSLFDVFVTMDAGMRHQQRLVGRAFGTIVVRARSNDIDDILPLIPAMLDALRVIVPGGVMTVSEQDAQDAPGSEQR